MEQNPLFRVVLVVVTLLLSVCVHEWAHAFAAWKLGDDTAARQGRLSLNPLVHADTLGTLILPAVFAFAGGFGFGWGKPVPYIPTNLTRKYSMRAGEAIVAFAGPLSNLIMAILCGAVLGPLIKTGVIAFNGPFYLLLRQMIVLNLVLFLFNLFPVPPLDGSKIAAWMFGQKADHVLDKIQSFGPIALIAVILLGAQVISPIVGVLFRAIWNTLVI